MFGDEDNSETDQNKFDELLDLEEEIDLSAILAELDDENSLEEAKDEEDEEYEDDDEEGDEETEDETEEESVEVSDMTVDELKDLIKDIVAQEMGGGEEDMMDMGDETGEEMPAGDEMGGEEEEINLDELLAELDALDEVEEDESEGLEEGKKKSKHEKGETKSQEKAEHVSGKEKKEKSEMKEALDTINILRKELNEVNLLNAKLLYVNKIFKSKNLSESQKVQVIASFDKATNVKEAKVVFESLNTALAATNKPIKESLGFASKAAGVAPQKQQIVESNDVVSRMQKLANIIK